MQKQDKRDKARMETWTKDFDLCAVAEMEWAAPLKSIFTSEAWSDLEKRRRTLFRVISHKPDIMAFTQLKKTDAEMASLLFANMVEYACMSQQMSGERRISIREHFNDFIRTKEQKDAYQEYCDRIDSVVMLADVIEGMVMDALNLLHIIDPSVIVDEFKGVQNALKALQDFTSIHHKTEHNELTAAFCDFAEEVQEWIVPKTHLFLKQYEDKAQVLIKKGEMKRDKKKRSDRDFAIETLTHYFFYNGSPHQKDYYKSRREAERFVKDLDDEQLKDCLPYIITADRELNRIAMALDNLSASRKSMEACKGKDYLKKLSELKQLPEWTAKKLIEKELSKLPT